MSEIISVKNLSYAYGGHIALEDVSFEVAKGEVAGIIGPNGSGKTTLLKLILGLMEPDSGEIRVDGGKPSKSISKIGYVPQKFEFDRSIPLTVHEFMSLEKCGEKLHGCGYIEDALRNVGLKNIENRLLGDLSGGQFQRVMIARAVLHEKEILIFDEPSTGIDIAGEKTVYDLIASLNKEKGTTCLIVSHELNIVNRFAHRVLCLNKKMVCYGAPEQAITPETLRKLYGIDAGLYHAH